MKITTESRMILGTEHSYTETHKFHETINWKQIALLYEYIRHWGKQKKMQKKNIYSCGHTHTIQMFLFWLKVAKRLFLVCFSLQLFLLFSGEKFEKSKKITELNLTQKLKKKWTWELKYTRHRTKTVTARKKVHIYFAEVDTANCVFS